MAARTKKVGSAVVAGVIVVTGIYVASVAGSLEPPAPPAPTMKTLDEVEPRTPIHAAQLPYVIFEPGSYYLAEDVETFDSGIYITSDNVTLDLMGHRLSGGTSFGIEALTPVDDVVIRNGTVSGWGISGIYAVGSRIRIEAIHAIDNAVGGIVVGDHATVYGCTATGNNVGIEIGNYGSVVESMASNNVGDGIDAGQHPRITSCTTSGNGDTGIRVEQGGIVRDSVSSMNEAYGILVTSSSYVLNNNCYGNGLIQGGSGILAEGLLNRIDGNHLIGNDTGLSVIGPETTIMRNSLSGNVQDYVILVGNDLGPFQNAAAGMSPWGNIVF